MADKKISALTERTSPILGTDLLIIVSDLATTPTNYRVKVKNFLAAAQVDLPATAWSAMNVTANVVANSVAIQSAGLFTLNAGNSSIGSSNAYGMLINHGVLTSGSVRAASPQAYFGVLEAAGSGGAQTLYLMDIGLQGTANVSGSATVVNAAAVFSKAAASPPVASHVLKIQVNGKDLWVLTSNVAPA